MSKNYNSCFEKLLFYEKYKCPDVTEIGGLHSFDHAWIKQTTIMIIGSLAKFLTVPCKHLWF